MTEGNPLISLLEECVVRIECDGEFGGSGFFVAPGEVLTCAHVLAEGKPIAVGQHDWESEATLIAAVPPLAQASEPGSFPFPDLALLRLSDAPASHPCAGLSDEMPAAGAEADLLRLSAYSRDAHRPGVEHNGGTVVFEGPFGDFGMLKLREGQVLLGFSGSPVLNLRTGKVCGVIDSTRDKESDLGGFAIPISLAAKEFEGLLERNEAALADGVWKEAVEGERVAAAARRGEAEKLPIVPPPYKLDPRADYAPSELLKPRYSVVELVEREELQANLMRWRESAKALDVLILSGSGGAGKTRLALEECARAERAGWMAGLFSLDALGDAGAQLERLLEWPGRLFLAIDYAETRPDVVGSLIKRRVRRSGGAPLRLVLICRQVRAKPQLEELFAHGDDREAVAEAIRRAEPVRLGDPEHQLDGRRLFAAGLAAFQARLGQPEATDGARVSMRQDHFARPLFVLAAALLRAEDPSIDVDALEGNELMLELIDRHEAQYWERWNESLGTGLDRSLHGRAVALATMLGADGEEEATSLVGAVPGLDGVGAERKLAIARWLSHLYAGGGLDSPPAIAPMEPDLLAEALVGRECAAQPELVGRAFDAADDSQLVRLLNLMARVSDDNEPVAEQVRQALDQRLPDLVERATSAEDPELVAALDQAVTAVRPWRGAAAAAIPSLRGSSVLGELTLNLLKLAIEAHSAQPEPAEEALANLHLLLASALAERERREEAAEEAEEAARRFQALSSERQGEFSEQLADSLKLLASVLAKSNRAEEAAGPAREAVERLGELAEEAPERHRVELAEALNTLTVVLLDLRDHEEAAATGTRNLGLRRELAEEDPPAHKRDLAGAMTNLSSALNELDRQEEAVKLTEEAIGLLGELAEEDPERHRVELANAHGVLARALIELEEYERALGAAEEATVLWEMLEYEGESYRLQLAISLAKFAGLLELTGQHGRLVTACREKEVQCWTALVEEDRGEYLLGLAMALGLLGEGLFSEGWNEAAAEVMEAAVASWRELMGENRGLALPALAKCLGILSTALFHLGEGERSLSAIEEAVECQRELVREDPSAHKADLATWLSSLSSRLVDLGAAELAIAPSEEAVALGRELVEEDRGEHLPELARALNNLSSPLGKADRDEEATKALEEVLVLQRELAAAPEHDPLHLIAALNNLANGLSGERGEEAIALLEEALELSREAAREDRRRYLPRLSAVLDELLAHLVEAERDEEGGRLVEAVVAEYDEGEGDEDAILLRLTLAKWQLHSSRVEEGVGTAAGCLERAEEAGDVAARAKVRMLLRTARKLGESGFDAAWEGELPPWLRWLEPSDELIDLHLDWLQTETPAEGQAFLEEHADAMLSDESEAALVWLIDSNPRRPLRARQLEILQIARAEGIAVPFEDFERREAILRRRGPLEELLTLSGQDALEFLRTHEVLLDPEAEWDLLGLVIHEAETPDWPFHLGLLAVAANAGVEAAADLIDGGPDRDDADFLRSAEDGEMLALARIRAGLDHEGAESQFQHALAATVVGIEMEAELAVERCHERSSSWERQGFARSLDALARSHPEHEEALASLKEELLDEAPAEAAPADAD